MIQQNITLWDYVLLPFYLLVIFIIAYAFRNKLYPAGHPWRPYFIPGLSIKIVGAISIGLLYEYYYKGGDTFNYFFHAKTINSAFADSPARWLRLITHSGAIDEPVDAYYISELWWYDAIDTYATSSIIALIGMFCFSKYLAIAAIVATIAFTGMWALFRTFALQYPDLTKQIAIATLFMPSTIVWGSGIFKDTFCMFALGWLCYTFFQIFERRVFKLRLVLVALMSITILYIIKSYILFAFLPILLAKTILSVARSYKKLNLLFIPLIILAVLFSGRIYTKIEPLLNGYSINQIAEVAKHSKDYLLQISSETGGAGYDLGDFEPTLKGMFKKFVPAINVTLFRPYLWEAKSPLLMFGAVESFFLMALAVLVIIKRRIIAIIKQIFSDPNLIMCLAFTLIFAFFTGITTYNFGSLSRYKIPCIPFFTLFLLILYHKKTKKIDKSHEVLT